MLKNNQIWWGKDSYISFINAHYLRANLYPPSTPPNLITSFSFPENCRQSFATCLDTTKTLQLPENSIPSSSDEIKDTCGWVIHLLKFTFKFLSPVKPNRPQNHPVPNYFSFPFSSRFADGMTCVNHYLDKCANTTVRNLIEREINGAKRFFQHLCGSKKFQENYLYHASCIQATRPDWNECIRQYRTIIHHEINATPNDHEPRTAVQKSLHYCW